MKIIVVGPDAYTRQNELNRSNQSSRANQLNAAGSGEDSLGNICGLRPQYIRQLSTLSADSSVSADTAELHARSPIPAPFLPRAKSAPAGQLPRIGHVPSAWVDIPPPASEAGWSIRAELGEREIDVRRQMGNLAEIERNTDSPLNRFNRRKKSIKTSVRVWWRKVRERLGFTVR